MLKDNIKLLRKSKGLSQEELAVKLNVVRQTISKWEQGLSVPDSQMLVSISEIFETPVSTLLGENIEEAEADKLKAISEKLEVINLQLLKRNEAKRKLFHWVFILFSTATVIIFAVLFLSGSPYLNWNEHFEYAVLGVAFQSFEWLFIRIAPVILILSVVGAVLTRKKA